jgi:hypothetical protein
MLPTEESKLSKKNSINVEIDSQLGHAAFPQRAERYRKKYAIQTYAAS